MKLLFCPLFSGSSGNATWVQAGDCAVLVDAGKSCRQVELAAKAVKLNMHHLCGILITHEHSDHISGIFQLSKRYDLPVYANYNTWLALGKKAEDIAQKNRRIFETGQEFFIHQMGILPFATPHDAAESVGYVIRANGKTAVVMTDLGHINSKIVSQIQGADIILLESNHDIEMLQTGAYPVYLKRRILSRNGHLSNQDAADLGVVLANANTKRFILGHLSAENNTETLALKTFYATLKVAGIEAGEDVFVGMAERERAVSVYPLY